MTINRPSDAFAGAEDVLARCARLERQLARERAARKAAEDIAEQGLRDYYLGEQRLLLLSRIASFANECTEPADALRFAVEQVRDHLGWAVGHALVVNGEGSNRYLEGTDAWSLRDPHLYFPFIDASRHLIAWPGDVLPGCLFADARTCFDADLPARPGFSRAAAARRCRLQGAIAVPIMAGRDLAAALEFFATDTNPPEPGVLEILDQIGAQIGRVFSRRRHADQLLRGTLTDPVTGLPNRAALAQDSDGLLRAARAGDAAGPAGPGGLALLCIGVDGLQLVNDTLGHAAGDALIRAIADRLRLVVAERAELPGLETLRLARLAGHCFVILLAARQRSAAARHIAAAVHEAMAPVLDVAGHPLHVATHIGMAFDRPDYAGLDELLRDADVALVAARASGPGRSILFADAMRAEALQRLELEAALRAAIDAGDFVLHYQPIVAMADGRVLGFEALVRWRRDDGGLVMPDQFIALAEATGLIVPIGTWVLREACRAIVRLRAGRQSSVYVAVNVAAQQFQRPSFVAMVRDILLETGADPAMLRLELTETSAMANPDQVRRMVFELKAMGVKVSLDDFGTGYSSLATLQAIPFDTVKVDSVFVRHQAQDDADWSIVAAVKGLADAMGMSVVVEGVESEYQRSALALLGCGIGQGYYFDRPLPEVEAARKAGLAVIGGSSGGHDKRRAIP